MKNLRKLTIIVSFLFLTFCVSAQNISITDSLNRWNIGLNCVNEEPINPYNRWSTYFVHIEGDTVMNEMNYKRLVHCLDSMCINKSFKSFIREDSGKVFLADKTREVILYDFNLKQGDTLTMYFLRDIMKTKPLYVLIDSVKTGIFHDQKERILQYVSVYPYYWENSFNDVLVEGTGSMRFGLEYPGNLFITGASQCYPNFLCFYTDDNIVYSNPEFNDCYISTGAPVNNPSHDYQTVYSNRVAFFENSEKQIKALRIDSIKVNTDSVFYPFATIQEISENCFSPYKASWIGEKVVVKPDGTNLFFNRDGDTITLKTRARLNESWIAFQRSDDFRVKATVQSVGMENFLGLSDSVKTIILSVIDQNESTLEHPLNNLKLRISKNYGFVETLNFYLFPDIEVHDTQEQLENLSLTGLTNPTAGVQNLTWFEVNDFQPGDELHVLEESSSWIEHAGDRIGYSITNKANFKYLERTETEDSIVYRFTRKQSIETEYPDSTTLELYNDTLKSVISANPAFDKLPGEPIIDDIYLVVYNFYMTSGTILSKTNPKQYENFHAKNDSCWGMIIFDGCARNNTYFKGLGGPYYKCTNCCSLGGEERKLVYYKKGETEWGEKLVITGVSEIKSSDDLQFFPNPVNDFVAISNPCNIQIKRIELIDFSGRVVQTWKAQELVENTLNIQHIPPGIYLLKATTEAGIKTGKLVVQ